MAGAPYLIIALRFGLATGIIGRAKGSSFFIWFLVGTVLPFFGLIAVILYRSEHDRARAPVPDLQQDPEALRPGLPALRHRPLPAGPLRGGRAPRSGAGALIYLSQVRTIALAKPRP